MLALQGEHGDEDITDVDFKDCGNHPDSAAYRLLEREHGADNGGPLCSSTNPDRVVLKIAGTSISPFFCLGNGNFMIQCR